MCVCVSRCPVGLCCVSWVSYDGVCLSVSRGDWWFILHVFLSVVTAVNLDVVTVYVSLAVVICHCVSLDAVMNMGVSPDIMIIVYVHLGFPGGSVVKNPPINAGDMSSIPVLGRSPGGGNVNPLQYSCLKNPMDRGAWWATVHRVAKSRTRLSH